MEMPGPFCVLGGIGCGVVPLALALGNLVSHDR